MIEDIDVLKTMEDHVASFDIFFNTVEDLNLFKLASPFADVVWVKLIVRKVPLCDER